ncbi:MAG: hypothetical protein KAG64_09085 [Bacteroidales bacterium]|nr:hypothetical protein [Bacteroidales bacterium]
MNTVGFAYLHIENNRRDEILDDLSTASFHSILYDLFSLRSPFGFRDSVDDAVLDQIGLLVWLENLISAFDTRNQISISEFNSWPNDIFDANEIAKNLPEEYQQYQSESAFWIFLIEKSGVVRNMDGHWFLSKATKKCKGNRKALLQLLIEGIGFRVNWSVLDGKSAKETGQLAFGMSIILMYKYGEEFRDVMFYTNKYFPIFELAREESHIDSTQTELDFIQVYIYRTFYCFAQMFGFVEIKEEQTLEGVTTQVRTTPLFRALFEFRM